MSGKNFVKLGAALTVLVALAATLTTQPVPIVRADPCGMVPPIRAGKFPEIERTGLKKTYVFHKNGIETFAIRPGFAGKLSEFGMLVPVPSTPSIKKIADSTFDQIEKAIDPPEVMVWVGEDWDGPNADSARPTSAVGLGGQAGGGMKYKDQVTVVKQEAVGMYTVVVLEAGSSKALKKWIDENGYRFPDGMEGTCEEYIGQGWQFVAVKAKIGAKPGIEPKPGMTEPNPNLPDEARFEGLGQGMAFRFKSEKLVVPMRLSTFNAGDTHNVVYLLTDKPMEVKNLPKEFVVRQVSGTELYLNITQPLPLRLLGGTEKDLTPEIMASVAQQRDPAPHNGIARELFCADLVAARQGNVTLEFEEREKDYLNISQELGLRGEEIDTLHRQAAKVERGRDYDAALVDLLGMTLTVIDGEFDRDVLRRDNLNFAAFEMPATRNVADSYHAPSHGPQGTPAGVRWVDTAQRAAALDIANLLLGKPVAERKAAIVAAEKRGENIFVPPASTVEQGGSNGWLWGILGAGAMLLVLVSVAYLKRRKAGSAAVLAVGLGLLALPGTVKEPAQAAEQACNPAPKADAVVALLISDLANRTKAEKAVGELVALGARAYPPLAVEALSGSDFVTRGWCIVAMSRIGGTAVDASLRALAEDTSQAMLVRNWAGAARIAVAPDPEKLLALVPMVQTMPALARPLAKRLAAFDGGVTAEALLKLADRNPALQDGLVEIITDCGADELAKVMYTSGDMKVRMTAARYLGGMPDAASAVISALAFSVDRDKAPWDGGPLYVPGISWTKVDGEKLVTALLSWGLWCERAGKTSEIQQVTNNLNSVSLAHAVGYEMNWNTAGMANWLKVWGKAKGKAAVVSILEANKAQDDSRYAGVLDGLK